MSPSENWLIAPAIALIGALIACVLLRRMASVLGLIDRPSGRKQHAMPTPLVGGLAMFCGLSAAWILIPAVRPHWAWVVAFTLIVFLGVLDDRRPLSARLKFWVQVVIGAIVVVLSDLGLPHLGEILPGWTPQLLWLAIPFSVFAIVSVINAINMIDGVDGLAGSLCLVAVATLSAAAFWAGSDAFGISLAALGAVLLGFLVFNLPLPGGRSARLFMGDAGSMGMGLLIACFALRLSDPRLDAAVPAAVALWACAVPLADGFSVILRRRARRAGATSPGRDHLHHFLLDRGFSAGQVVALEAGAGLVMSAVALTLWQMDVPQWVLVGLFVAGIAVFHFWQTRSWSAESRAEDSGFAEASATDVQSGSVVAAYPSHTETYAVRGAQSDLVRGR